MFSSKLCSCFTVLLFYPGRGAKYWGQSVCLSVGLSVSIVCLVCYHISKMTRPNFTKFAAAGCCSDGSAILPVLYMMSCFHIRTQMG